MNDTTTLAPIPPRPTAETTPCLQRAAALVTVTLLQALHQREPQLLDLFRQRAERELRETFMKPAEWAAVPQKVAESCLTSISEDNRIVLDFGRSILWRAIETAINSPEWQAEAQRATKEAATKLVAAI